MTTASEFADPLEITAIRLTTKRRFAKPGDIFRLSPAQDVVLWGRVVQQGEFFGARRMSLVYIYDVISPTLPTPSALTPKHLIIGPMIVKNLGWVRGYWEIVASRPLDAGDVLERHLFKAPLGVPPHVQWEIVDDRESPVSAEGVDPEALSIAGIGNFNFIDHLVRGILARRGVVSGLPNKPVQPTRACGPRG